MKSLVFSSILYTTDPPATENSKFCMYNKFIFVVPTQLNNFFQKWQYTCLTGIINKHLLSWKSVLIETILLEY